MLSKTTLKCSKYRNYVKDKQAVEFQYFAIDFKHKITKNTFFAAKSSQNSMPRKTEVLHTYHIAYIIYYIA